MKNGTFVAKRTFCIQINSFIQIAIKWSEKDRPAESKIHEFRNPKPAYPNPSPNSHFLRLGRVRCDRKYLSSEGPQRLRFSIEIYIQLVDK